MAITEKQTHPRDFPAQSVTHLNLTVIVPVYNHWHLVPELLACLESQTLDKSRFELLLVDNGSDSVPTLALPEWARLLVCPTPGSYAARNEAIRQARGPLLAFTDADCRPRPQWLEKGLAECRAGHMAGIVAGGISVEPEDWNRISLYEIYDVALGLPQKRFVRYGFGVTANLFVPRAVIDKVGPFESKRFSGGDAEFCRRATSLGVALSYCEDASIMHPARRSWRELESKLRRVKGGQLAAGPLKRRVIYAVRTVMPPAVAWLYAMAAPRLSFRQRLLVCWVQFRLWFVELSELFRLLRGKRPVR
ncbi:MAG: glycosyltransferase family A protein [Alphaproteobacteria bacterium]|nr:glycosyltransferase family A protein [Alphaproteobacteria bacterium]